MIETTHDQPVLFAIEVEPSDDDLSQNLLAYRRLTARERAAVAAELKRKIEIEIAADSQGRGRRVRPFVRNVGYPVRAQSAWTDLMRSVFPRSPYRRALDRARSVWPRGSCAP